MYESIFWRSIMEISAKVAIIGGSGVYKIDGVETINELVCETPFGAPSDKIIHAKLDGQEFYFLARHNRNHNLLPHEVNYRANIFALKKLGVKRIVSVSAVGSLKEELPPGTLFFPDQFIDWTRGKRERTFFGNGIVAHVSAADPINKDLKKLLVEHAKKSELKFSENGSYICIEGPQFSTRAESHLYRSFQASVIGMTNVPEAFLAKEAGMAYATIAMVTDFDGWKEEHCNVEDIMKVMQENNKSAHKLLKSAISDISSKDINLDLQNQIGLMTSRESLSGHNKEIVDVLMS